VAKKTTEQNVNFFKSTLLTNFGKNAETTGEPKGFGQMGWAAEMDAPWALPPFLLLNPRPGRRGMDPAILEESNNNPKH